MPRLGLRPGVVSRFLGGQTALGKGLCRSGSLEQADSARGIGLRKGADSPTHGGDGYVCTYYAPEKLGVGPPDKGATNEGKSSRFLRMSVFDADNKPGAWESVAVNSDLRLVYVFGCNVGTQAAEWEEHLAPARVITYKRESTIFDQCLWFAFVGPAQLNQLR